MNYLLIAVLLLLAWNLFDGYRKGFMRTVFALVSWIIVLIACSVSTPVVTDFLMEKTSVAKSVGDTIAERINETIEESGVAELEQNLPEELRIVLLGEDKSVKDIIKVDGSMIMGATSIVRTIVSIIAFVVVVIVARVFVWMVDKALGIASKLPIIGSLDKLLGILCGGARGMLICWIMLAVVSIVALSNADMNFAPCIENSLFLTWMQQNNFILKMFGEGQFFL